MTREERERILSAAEIAEAHAQADRALNTVGIPPQLINELRPILVPVAEALTAEEATSHATAA